MPESITEKPCRCSTIIEASPRGWWSCGRCYQPINPSPPQPDDNAQAGERDA